MKAAVRGKLSSLSVLIWVLFNESSIKRRMRGAGEGGAAARRRTDTTKDAERGRRRRKRQRDIRLHQSENRAVFCFIRQGEVSIIRLCQVKRGVCVRVCVVCVCVCMCACVCCVCVQSPPDSMCWEHCKCMGNGCQCVTAINGPLVLSSALHWHTHLSSLPAFLTHTHTHTHTHGHTLKQRIFIFMFIDLIIISTNTQQPLHSRE